jgi:hypothetical protein
MDTSQRISLYHYLYCKLAKTPCFAYYLLWFFLYKIREEEGGTGSAQRWHKECVDMEVNAKMIPIETIPGMGGGGMKESSGRGEFKHDIFDTV